MKKTHHMYLVTFSSFFTSAPQTARVPHREVVNVKTPSFYATILLELIAFQLQKCVYIRLLLKVLKAGFSS